MVDGDYKTKAYASVTIAGAFAVHGLRVIETDKGRFISMPQAVSYTHLDTEAFLKCLREELPYRPTTGFRYEVLSDDPTTVSYTHLDVYKRQGYHLSSFAMPPRIAQGWHRYKKALSAWKIGRAHV